MDTAGPQQSLHLLGRFFNHLARIIDLNHQLNESLISAVETPRQDYRNIEEHCCAPAYSEFLKRDNVRHTWMCDKCDYEFETLIWLNIPPAVS